MAQLQRFHKPIGHFLSINDNSQSFD